MLVPRSALLWLFTSCSVLSIQSCYLEEPSDSEQTTTTNTGSNDDCSEIGSNLAHLLLAGEQRNVQLLQYFTEAEIVDLRANTCLSKEPSENVENVADDRAAGLKGRFWAPGTTIRVRFLNGSASLQQKVFSYAKEWESYADIKFQKVTSGGSEVRVFFGNDGHWSYVGTDNRSIEACSETMSLQLSDQSPANDIRRVALHEFGHVLGMRHEHQQPLASIPWNSSAVYTYYAQEGWSKQDVDEQVLNKNSQESTQYTKFDAASIMEYPVPASLTTNGFSIGWNSQLSATDKSFVGLMYSSKRMQIRHAATGYNSNITFQIAGIYHTVKPGETMSVPALSGINSLSIWEQPTGGSWSWDSAYSPVYGKKYKIVRVGSSKDLTLAAE